MAIATPFKTTSLCANDATGTFMVGSLKVHFTDPYPNDTHNINTCRVVGCLPEKILPFLFNAKDWTTSLVASISVDFLFSGVNRTLSMTASGSGKFATAYRRSFLVPASNYTYLSSTNKQPYEGILTKHDRYTSDDGITVYDWSSSSILPAILIRAAGVNSPFSETGSDVVNDANGNESGWLDYAQSLSFTAPFAVSLSSGAGFLTVSEIYIRPDGFVDVFAELANLLFVGASTVSFAARARPANPANAYQAVVMTAWGGTGDLVLERNSATTFTLNDFSVVIDLAMNEAWTYPAP
jgi:hypothetical protein